jgi:hypothetical protein
LKDLRQAGSPPLAVGEIAEWFSANAYLPKLRDRVVLETSIRDAIGKFDADFGYAERFDAAGGVGGGVGGYEGLIYAKAAPEILSLGGLLVRAEVAKQQAITIPVRGPGPTPRLDPGRRPAGSGGSTPRARPR